MRHSHPPPPRSRAVLTWRRGVVFRSNHGSYYYNQLAALQILVNDTAGANSSIQKYFSTPYQNQISANGEQVRCGCSVVPDSAVFDI